MSEYFLGVIFGFWMAWVIWSDDAPDLRTEAVRRGFAAYVITNPETGAVSFQWKDGAK